MTFNGEMLSCVNPNVDSVSGLVTQVTDLESIYQRDVSYEVGSELDLDKTLMVLRHVAINNLKECR